MVVRQAKKEAAWWGMATMPLLYILRMELEKL